MTQPDQDVSRVNPGSPINPGSRINPESRINPDSQINLESQINCPIWINSSIRPTFNISMTWSAGRRTSRQRDKFDVAYNVYVDPNWQARNESKILSSKLWMLLSSKNNSGTQLNIQMTRPDQEISRINPESRINSESRVNTESQFNPDSQINLDSRINYPIRINSSIWPTFKTPLTQPTENTPSTQQTEVHHQNIQMTRPDQDVSRVKSRNSNQSSELNQSGEAIQS